VSSIVWTVTREFVIMFGVVSILFVIVIMGIMVIKWGRLCNVSGIQ